ncbi:hypothetical protein MASR2M79_08660 [Aminivibrio sp.]
MSWRFLTSGESHGRGLLVIVDGLPSGLTITRDYLTSMLARRRRGFGRGSRMALEGDELTLWGGIRGGVTTGGPVGISVGNSEWEKWSPVMDPWILTAEEDGMKTLSAPRPGHADLAGGIKFDHKDMRSVLERASARSTAPRTLAGALAGRVLSELGVTVRSAVESIGGIFASLPETLRGVDAGLLSELGVTRPEDEEALKKRILQAAEEGDSLGGTFVLSITGLPRRRELRGWDERLDGLLGQASPLHPRHVKGRRVRRRLRGDLPGSRLHDPIVVDGGQCIRPSNNAGGSRRHEQRRRKSASAR